MNVHDAELGDIYVDEQGKLWRCIMTCREPTVTFEAVEGYVQSSSNAALHAAAQAPPPIIKPQQRGGVSGLMWNGWKRIWRNPNTTQGGAA